MALLSSVSEKKQVLREDQVESSGYPNNILLSSLGLNSQISKHQEAMWNGLNFYNLTFDVTTEFKICKSFWTLNVAVI